MFEMFQFDFMRRALLAGLMLSIMIPLIGVVMVNRKTSMIGDALSHTSLMGVAIGLIAGFNPAFGAIVIAVISAFAIEIIRKRFPQYGDMATAVIMLSFRIHISCYKVGFDICCNSFCIYICNFDYILRCFIGYIHESEFSKTCRGESRLYKLYFHFIFRYYYSLGGKGDRGTYGSIPDSFACSHSPFDSKKL